MVPSAALRAAVHAVVVHSAVEATATAAGDIAVVVDTAAPSEAVHTATVADTAAVDIVVAVAAEWADADKSEHQFPDFRIQHLRNLAH